MLPGIKCSPGSNAARVTHRRAKITRSDMVRIHLSFWCENLKKRPAREDTPNCDANEARLHPKCASREREGEREGEREREREGEREREREREYDQSYNSNNTLEHSFTSSSSRFPAADIFSVNNVDYSSAKEHSMSFPCHSHVIPYHSHVIPMSFPCPVFLH
ncbi:hypothetical protein DPEC_G00147820 [Dallia pectoralis]|uniref:Uncharacterized protein n=1 Tax=Dallia pectoralis TaxID=75939 RepID=A0ACC2GI37_DALPE|nr:hypothetical protein DPEC_G00147820 [Dallia pectoralis]